MPAKNPTELASGRQALLACAEAFAKTHGLDPLEVLRAIIDLALIRRGLTRWIEESAQWN